MRSTEHGSNLVAPAVCVDLPSAQHRQYLIPLQRCESHFARPERVETHVVTELEFAARYDHVEVRRVPNRLHQPEQSGQASGMLVHQVPERVELIDQQDDTAFLGESAKRGRELGTAVDPVVQVPER